MAGTFDRVFLIGCFEPSAFGRMFQDECFWPSASSFVPDPQWKQWISSRDCHDMDLHCPDILYLTHVEQLCSSLYMLYVDSALRTSRTINVFSCRLRCSV